MRQAELKTVLASEHPGAGLFEPYGEEWGSPLDVLCVENGRISAHVMVKNDLDLKVISRCCPLAIRSVTELWVFTTPSLVNRVRSAFSIDVGVRVMLGDGALGIARPATVRHVDVSAWIHRMSAAERTELAAELNCSPTVEDLAQAGSRTLGEDGMRRMVASLFGKRCPSPPLPPSSLDPLTILAAVRNRLSHEVVIL